MLAGEDVCGVLGSEVVSLLHFVWILLSAVLCASCLQDPAGIALLIGEGKGLISIVINH